VDVVGRNAMPALLSLPAVPLLGALLLQLLQLPTVTSAPTGAPYPSAPVATNIMLLVVDDLRPQIRAYGVEWMHTPHIDQLAAEGMLFERAYVQQSICAPTRNSFLSGRYPDKTRAWNFIVRAATTRPLVHPASAPLAL
jgi:iduronate 2-sulfatase